MLIKFSWRDTYNNELYTSYDINLEYYSVLYNLAIVYCSLARTVDLKAHETTDDKLKEGIKNFQYAAWIFDKIRIEVALYVSDSELQPDLTTENLQMVYLLYFIKLAQCYVSC